MGEQADADEESVRATLARTLKMLRERAGKSLGQLAEDTAYDKSYLSRLESGERLSTRQVMADLDEFYGTGDLLCELWEFARRDVFKAAYQGFIEYEASATIMHKYMETVPGLLQTEGYAREVLSASPGMKGKHLEEQLVVRMSRKQILLRDPAPNIRVILDEGVLRRPAADPAVWCEQLEYFIESSGNESMVLQVLPFAAGVHDLMGGSLSLLWQADGSAVAYFEGNKSGGLVEDVEAVAAHRLSYDRLRDLALSPPDSVALIERLLEENRR